jgi:hypothetical protein
MTRRQGNVQTLDVASPREHRTGAGRALPVWVGFVSTHRGWGPSGLYLRIGSRSRGFVLIRRQFVVWTALAWLLFVTGFLLGGWVM